MVNRAGGQFLARPAFAAKVNAGVGGSHDRDAFEYLLDRGRMTDDRSLAVLGKAGIHRYRGRWREAIRRPLNHPLGRRQVERLEQIFERSVADRLDRRGQIAEGRDDDDRHRPHEPTKVMHGGHAAHAGEPHVEHDHVRPPGGGRLEPLFGRGSRGHAVAE